MGWNCVTGTAVPLREIPAGPDRTLLRSGARTAAASPPSSDRPVMRPGDSICPMARMGELPLLMGWAHAG